MSDTPSSPVEDEAWVAAFATLANGLSHLNPDHLPDLVARSVALVRGRNAQLLLVDLEQRMMHRFGATGDSFPVEGGGPGAAFRAEKVLAVPLDAEAERVQLWIPLMDSAERLGVLGVDAPGHGDIERWTALASVVGEAIVSKAAYGDVVARVRQNRPLTLAAELRWLTLPPLTFTSSQVEIAGMLEPAYDIAGDTFDYAVGEDRADLAILDAMGHGLEASQIANLALGEHRRQRRAGTGIAGILRAVDEVVAEAFGDNRYVTAQLATLDLVSLRLTVANAGHPRPLLVRDGVVVGEVPCSPCPPLGLGMVDAELAELTLAPGEGVVFYTDGVVEARSPSGIEFGVRSLTGALEEAFVRGDRPSEIMRTLMRRLGEHAADPLQDDASALLVRVP